MKLNALRAPTPTWLGLLQLALLAVLVFGADPCHVTDRAHPAHQD